MAGRHPPCRVSRTAALSQPRSGIVSMVRHGSTWFAVDGDVRGTEGDMQPIVQTLEVMAELDLEDDSELLRVLTGQSEQMHALVPDVVGMSVGTLEHDLTLTFAATDAEIAVLDLSPRLLDATEHVQGHVLYEHRWQRLAQETAAAAVSSTLTLPILAGGVVVSRVDLYAGSSEAFTNLHEDIAFVFGAWAPGAVINADLPFHTRQDA